MMGFVGCVRKGIGEGGWKMRSAVLAAVVTLALVAGCNPQAGKVHDLVRAEFAKDYPDCTIVVIVPDAAGTARGLTGNEVYETIYFKKKGSDEEQHVTWHCLYKNGWLIKDKNAGQEKGRSQKAEPGKESQPERSAQ
jgi:hypothetical protein